MTYIEPHNNPEITTGKYALYKEKKPESPPTGATQIMLGYYRIGLNRWQKSRIAYLKEPPFMAGDTMYINGDGKQKYIVAKVKETANEIWYYKDTLLHVSDISQLSHYYPGQQYDGEIKYVRKQLKKEVEEDTETSFSIKYTEEWQEVEEPLLNHISPGQDDTDQFEEDVDKGVILAEILN